MKISKRMKRVLATATTAVVLFQQSGGVTLAEQMTEQMTELSVIETDAMQTVETQPVTEAVLVVAELLMTEDPTEAPATEAPTEVPAETQTEAPTTEAPETEALTETVPEVSTEIPETVELEKSFQIVCEFPENAGEGDVMKFICITEGYEEGAYTIQWQYCATDWYGNMIGEWTDMEGATEKELSVVINEENVLKAWRVELTEE